MSDTKPIVFVVDDDTSVRESLELLIRSAGWEPETFASAQDFLNRPRAVAPSCLVLDIRLPGLNGLELQKLVAAERNGMPIIFITGYGDVPMTVQAMKAGAVEFLTKPFSGEVLLSAVANAIERSQAALSYEAETRAIRDRYDSLSPREREVMALVVAGRLNKQVGGELGISEITVKAHRGKVMRKMKAKSLADLVHLAATLRLSPAQSHNHPGVPHPDVAAERVVLLADDEDALRRLAARALARAGFRVLEARDGVEALELLTTLGLHVVWLVVSDISMPRMSGAELAEIIAQKWPTLPVLLMSGEGQPKRDFSGRFLPKPFTPETLVIAVRELLSQAPVHAI